MPETRLLILLILFSLSAQGCTFPWLGFLLSPHPGDYTDCELLCIREEGESKKNVEKSVCKEEGSCGNVFPITRPTNELRSQDR
jgi:hypothetical protein